MRVADEVGEKPMQGPFNAALAQATGGAVMVLDQSVNPFKRIWCLFEVSRLRELQRPFELICDLGSLSDSAGLVRGSKAEQLEIQQATCEALWNISASKAESSKEADKFSIWAEVADSGLRQGICGWGVERFFRQAATKYGIDHLDSACFAAFNLHMRSLLSTSLLQNVLASSDFKAAARCCAHGASFNEEQLEKLWANFDSERDRGDWLGQMLHQTVLTGNASLLHLLLELGVDAGHTLSDDYMTSLLGLGARNGHESVVRLMLEHGADASAARNDGVTVLMLAARSGHEPVVKLLLEHGADADAAGNDGGTALTLAAHWGHEPVVKLLLEHGADVGAARNDGGTALMDAAYGGHEPVGKLLLEHGADASAARNGGVTALMLAAQNGHEPVAKLLLEHGADASAATNDGVTALIFAAENGHEPVGKLLLEHGADASAATNNGVTTALTLAARSGQQAITG